jgi:hypothetical protein
MNIYEYERHSIFVEAVLCALLSFVQAFILILAHFSMVFLSFLIILFALSLCHLTRKENESMKKESDSDKGQ